MDDTGYFEFQNGYLQDQENFVLPILENKNMLFFRIQYILKIR